MIKAILAGAKSQTRRIVKHHGGIPAGAFWDHGAYMPFEWSAGEWSFRDRTNKMHGARASGAPEFKCPYGAAGDQLWVRETWQSAGADFPAAGGPVAVIAYRADGARIVLPHDPMPRDVDVWRPSIFMPRWASRITLEITEVRVERLNEISADDCVAEGISAADAQLGSDASWRLAYRRLWESINGVGSWALNPWVWAISFRRVT